MVSRIPEKLTQFRLPIEKYYQDDETFREIYDDYLAYFEALQLWAQSDSEDAPFRCSEYEKLVGELEQELTDILVNKHGVSQENQHAPQK